MHSGGSSRAGTEIKAPSKQSSNVPVSLAAAWVCLGGQAPITAMIEDEFIAFASLTNARFAVCLGVLI